MSLEADLAFVKPTLLWVAVSWDQHTASRHLWTAGNNCSWSKIFFTLIFRIRTGVQIYALPILCSLKEFGNSGPSERLWSGNGKGKEFNAWRWKLGKSQITPFLLPFSSSEEQKPAFTSYSLTHKEIKISSIFAHFDWKHWIDPSSNFSTCNRLDILTDILSLLQKQLQSASASGAFPSFLPFLSLPLPYLNSCWKEKEALKGEILTVGAGRGCCPRLSAVLD